MKQALFFFAALLGLATPVPISAALPVQSDVATEIAEQMAPREQMRGMVLATLSRTTTGGIIIQKLGQERGSALLVTETDKVVRLYGDDWARLLASAYREALSPDEVKRARAAMLAHDRAAMMPFMRKVGPLMQKSATPLLERASNEALKAAYEQMSKEPAR